MSSGTAETGLRAWGRRRMDGWLRRHLPASDRVTLHRSNIFILPTSHGLLFIATALIIFVAAINYTLSLAFALAFFMVSVFLLAILHSFLNLSGITLKGGGAEPAFAGELAAFNILLSRQPNRIHEALQLQFQGGDKVAISVASTQEQRLMLSIPVTCRGHFRAPRITIESSFPLGLWRAWSHVDLAQECIVYPHPQPCKIGMGSSAASGESTSTVSGVEDFQGLRDYSPGDSLKQIAWKNLARGQGLKVKQFVDGRDERRILDWQMFPGMDPEQRLSCLCYLVLQLEGSHSDYGLNLPGLHIEPDRGEAHQRRLLEALALWS